jgi:hypothetical protein
MATGKVQKKRRVKGKVRNRKGRKRHINEKQNMFDEKMSLESLFHLKLYFDR